MPTRSISVSRPAKASPRIPLAFSSSSIAAIASARTSRRSEISPTAEIWTPAFTPLSARVVCASLSVRAVARQLLITSGSSESASPSSTSVSMCERITSYPGRLFGATMASIRSCAASKQKVRRLCSSSKSGFVNSVRTLSAKALARLIASKGVSRSAQW